MCNDLQNGVTETFGTGRWFGGVVTLLNSTKLVKKKWGNHALLQWDTNALRTCELWVVTCLYNCRQIVSIYECRGPS